MNKQELIDKLKAIIAAAEATASPAASAPQSAPVVGSETWKKGTVSYWKVGATKSGKTAVRIGLEGDVYFSSFDEKIILANDPVQKGQEVEYQTRPWKDTEVVTALRKVGIVPSRAKVGIDEDEIPF